MASDLKDGTVASFTISNNKLVVTQLNDIYSGSKNLLIYDTKTVSSDNSSSGRPVPLYAITSATRGVLAGYYDANGSRHTVELSASGNYYEIPDEALECDGSLWISVYGSSGGARQQSNACKLYIQESNKEGG